MQKNILNPFEEGNANARPRVFSLKNQRDRFIETARALGADEDEAAFKAKPAVIARQKPKSQDLLPCKKKEPNHAPGATPS